MNKQYIYILSIILLFSCGEKNKYQYEISNFKPKLKKHLVNIIEDGELKYNSDTLTKNFLRDSCSEEDLLKLLNFNNPLIRIKAYQTIVNRNETDYFSILLNHLDDTTEVTYWYANDAASNMMVSDLMINTVKKKLTQKKKDSLVDKVLTQDIYLESSKLMMNDSKPNEKYYSIVKASAKKKLNNCHDLINTYSLSKFKKKEDIPLIKKNFSEYNNNHYCNNNYFKAIEAFPDLEFFPLLTKYFNEVIKKRKQKNYKELKYYCLSVAQYKNPNSLGILMSLTKKETYPDSWYLPRNKEYVFKAIHKYPSKTYDSLYHLLKPQMSDYVIKNLDKPDYDERKTW